ncbi:diguanylate cyclase [Desulfovibrio aerotolerans]|uniref:diguanylate cyclase n=1 Tax=Solidesulfovibrio aerotolerans TaxID=295255 RepID=A0A7C9MP77_9BACT|nr:GGDEF domain-containing protein [Solidesulfovibrio aerotolerans]MYL83452.1 diguanylate cyclase [Solidesulfovibrio aerotolerans]
MVESCPSDKCKVQNVCSEIHKLGYGDDPAWLAIILIVRNLLAKFSCFSESQKSMLKSYVFSELKKKDASPEHLDEVIQRLEHFFEDNKKCKDLKTQFARQNEMLGGMTGEIDGFLKQLFFSESSRSDLVTKYGNESLEVLNKHVEPAEIVNKMKVMVTEMLTAYRQEAEEWQQKAKSLEQMVNVDSLLSPLHNRGALEKYLRNEIANSSATGSELTVLMMDIDNFKEINDEFGHHIGDDVLRALAKIVHSHAAMYKWYAARYGGDELVVVCKSSAEEVMLHADAIKIAAQNYDFYTRKDEKVQKPSVKFTISIGIGEYVRGMTSDDLVDVADKAMYKVKMAGKNDVAVFEQNKEIS